MKLITTAEELKEEFRRLIKLYDKFYWATAWASDGDIVNYLLKNEFKIQKIIVGLHFYQTHPDFIEKFLDNKKVKFIEQIDGTFHPKLYLFTNNPNEWTLITGSANFTNAAFSKNTEASLLLTYEDNNSNNIYETALEFIEQKFEESKRYNEDDFKKYKIVWKNKQQHLKKVLGQYGEKSDSIPIHKSELGTMSWNYFVDKVKEEKYFEKRLKIIECAKYLFGRPKPFCEWKDDERLFIAGFPNKLNELDWKLFGNMSMAGLHNSISKIKDLNVSKALDEIPAFGEGEVTKKHYNNFIENFKKSFPGKSYGIATRLLCMKRPDVFMSFNGGNRVNFCKQFGIPESKEYYDYERYWNEIVEIIFDCDYYKNPDPKDDVEKRICEARAALLDSLYYKEKT